MERLEFRDELLAAFNDWKSGHVGPKEMERLNSAIRHASVNGIDLVLKAPKSIWENAAITRPMNKEDAKKYSREEGNFRVFDVPSERNIEASQERLRFELVAKDYNGRPTLLYKSPVEGILGMFYSENVEALDFK